MDLLEVARGALERVGYETSRADGPGKSFLFEDANVYGAVIETPVSTITSQWEEAQDRFLKRSASQLQSVPEKAWNVYVVFLSDETPDMAQDGELALIEEDFRGARKIARCGIRTREGLLEALAPLLPLAQVQPVDQIDVTARIREDPGIDHRVRDLIEREADSTAIVSKLLET